MARKSKAGSRNADPLHKDQGGPFPATYPKDKNAPHRVRVWIPREGSDLMISVLDDRGVITRSKSLKTRDPKQAEAKAWDLVSQLAVERAAKEKTLPFVTKPSGGPLKVGRMVSTYLGSADFASHSKSHRTEKETMLKRWVEFLGRNRTVESITRDDIKRYEIQRRKQVGQQRIYNEWSALRSVVNWALGERYLVSNPLSGISVATEKNPRQVPVTLSEFRALRNGSRGKVPLMCRIFLCVVEGTGRRKMAVANLRWEDVDLTEEVITWSEKSDKMGRRWEDVPASRRVFRILRMWRRYSPGPWVFQSERGQPFSKRAVDKWLGDMYSAAGMVKPERAGWHSFRRKFATELKDKPIKDVMEVGGWKSEAAYLRYVQPEKDVQRAIVNGIRRGAA